LNHIYGTLGIAKSARKLVSGDLLIDAIAQKRVNLVIVCEDASDRTKKNIQNKCAHYLIPCHVYGTVAQMSAALSAHRVAVGIADQGFSKSILNSLKEVKV